LKIIFAGTPDFSVPSLEYLVNSKHEVCAVYSQPDRAAGRGRKVKSGPVAGFAKNHNISIIQPNSFMTPGVLDELRAFNADLMVVVAYGLILPQKVLDTPSMGCINVHASLLPRWRGAAPIQRAIEAGDSKTGVTTMQMELGLDTGPMLKTLELSIEPHDTAGELHDRLAQLGALALSETLSDIGNGTLKPENQNPNLATYAAKIDKQEAQLDWSKSAFEIERKVCAFSPWPVARTQYNKSWLRIWKAKCLAETTTLPAGTIISDNRKFIDVATGEGLLRVLELQTPGGKRISTQSFLNAHPMHGIRIG